MSTNDNDQWMTTAEVRDALGVGQDTVRARIKDGSLVPFQDGADRRRWRFRRADVEALLRPVPVEVPR